MAQSRMVSPLSTLPTHLHGPSHLWMLIRINYFTFPCFIKSYMKFWRYLHSSISCIWLFMKCKKFWHAPVIRTFLHQFYKLKKILVVNELHQLIIGYMHGSDGWILLSRVYPLICIWVCYIWCFLYSWGRRSHNS